jgi:diketogulonate reductase-like aldo/keto reductase
MSKQPAQALLSLLNPQQQQVFNQIQSQPSDKQAEMIAQMCNQKGITKDQLAQLVNLISGNKS